MNRREFLVTTAVTAAGAGTTAWATRVNAQPATRSATTTSAEVPDDAVWRDVRDWGVEGRGFDDTENYFDRLPARAKALVRPEVWNLSRHSSGMSVRFEADTNAVFVRYTLLNRELAMAHMPATGMSGVDLYGKLHDGTWRWVATHSPKQQSIAAALHTRIAPGRRAYQLNLPLYNGVKSLEIGFPKDAPFAPIAPRKDKPILFYGTSITHGGCTSRPGMSFVNIIGRTLDRPVLNFGFSGNGKTEIEVARLLAELDPALFVIDTIANTSVEQINERMVPLVKLIREKRPSTPVLLLNERKWENIPLVPHQAESHQRKSDALMKAYETLKSEDVPDIHYRTGDDVLGEDGDATVDGSHPTDLGMRRYADALVPDLKRLLAGARG